MRRFYVSLQARSAETGWLDPEADGHRAADDAKAAVESWIWDNEDQLNDAAGKRWEGTLTVYVVEHDGDTRIGPLREVEVEYETTRQFGLATLGVPRE